MKKEILRPINNVELIFVIDYAIESVTSQTNIYSSCILQLCRKLIKRQQYQTFYISSFSLKVDAVLLYLSPSPALSHHDLLHHYYIVLDNYH